MMKKGKSPYGVEGPRGQRCLEHISLPVVEIVHTRILRLPTCKFDCFGREVNAKDVPYISRQVEFQPPFTASQRKDSRSRGCKALHHFCVTFVARSKQGRMKEVRILAIELVMMSLL